MAISSWVGAVDAYRQEKHALPATLRDLEPVWQVDRQGNALDWWHRPLIYQTEGSNYHIVSYGADGRPGGVGFDYDLSESDLGQDRPKWPKPPPESAPTFSQFVADRTGWLIGGGMQMVVGSAFTGVTAFVLSFVLMGTEARRRDRVGRGSPLGAVALTFLATLIMGAMMAMMEAPSGH